MAGVGHPSPSGPHHGTEPADYGGDSGYPTSLDTEKVLENRHDERP